MINMENRNLLDLSCEEAKEYFLKDENYCTINLPAYITFSFLLKEIDSKIFGKKFSDIAYTLGNKRVSEFDDVNHRMFINKNGCYSWRLFQLINPVIYVFLVNMITDSANWEILRHRFNELQKNSIVKCKSIPQFTSMNTDSRKEQITAWWTEFEQDSVKQAIDYSYIFMTDISDCFASIYTHSIDWAINGREEAKAALHSKKTTNIGAQLGKNLDATIRNMHRGETNGIPQGSMLMNFIAELVLGYADTILTKRLHSEMMFLPKFYMMRYRDDYRIYVNNPQDGETILKFLAETLTEFGLQLNSAKTAMSDDIIGSSIKEDKMYWLVNRNKQEDNQKQLYLLYDLSKKYPNSGALKKQLIKYFENLEIKAHDDIDAMLNIVVEIAYRNPCVLSQAMAIISWLLVNIEDTEKKFWCIKRIKDKFDKTTHSAYMEIWLQRITSKLGLKDCHYSEPLCKFLLPHNVVGGDIWNCEWINDANKELRELVYKADLIDWAVYDTLTAEISCEEISYFINDYPF